MDKLPIEITRTIYEYDSTYKELFDKSLRHLMAHSYTYRCSECFKAYKQCFCYCSTCRTYLIFCRQVYFDQDSIYEDELDTVIELY